MPDKSTYDFLDAIDTPVGPELTGPDLNEGATRRSMGVRPPANKPFQADFVSRNFRGIPIDLDMQSSSDVKTKLLAKEKPEDKIAFLEEMAGKGNVRLADNGEPIVTIWDEKRKAPVEFRPLGGGANIIPHVQAVIPEIVGGALGLAGAKKLPLKEGSRFLKFASEMMGASVGEKAGAAAKDIAVSSTPFQEILTERAGQIPEAAALNAVIGGVGTGVAKVGGRVMSPFGGAMSPVEQGASDAVAHFANKFGVDYPMTPAERISSPLFKRVEATMSRQPGSSSHFDKVQRQKVEALRQIQTKMLSSKLDPSDIGMLRKLEEDVGEDAINAIRQSVNPLQRAEDIARNSAARNAHDALLTELERATGPAQNLAPNAVGAKLRAGAFSKRDAFQNEAERLYGDTYRLPGGTERILTAPNLAEEASARLKTLASVEKTTDVPSRIVGPTGQPLVSSVTETEVLKPFVPEGIETMLKKLADTRGGRVSLQDLVQARTEVRNGIRKGESIRGTDTHHLGEIEDMLTKGIEEATGRMPTGELRDAWQKANQFYRENVTQFKDKNVAKLFRDNETGAFIQDEDLIRNMGPTEYQTYKNFFGANSEEFNTMRRHIVENLLPGGGEKLIDPKEFLRRLYDFTDPRKNKVIADDILGPQMTQRLERIGGLMKGIQEGDVVDRDGIINLLMTGNHNKLASSLDEMVLSQRKLNEVYKSQIIRDIAQGKLGQNFDSTEFVNRLWDKASPGEIKAIKAQLANNPKVLEDLERKAAERIFEQSQRKASGLDPSRVEPGEPYRRGSGTSIENVFGTEQNKARIKELLGEERLGDFEQLAKILRGGEAAETAFAGAGGFSTQMQIHQMFRGGVLSYLTDWAQQKIGAAIYFLPPVREAFINQVGRNPRNQAAAVRAAVLSKPFMEAMTEDFGDKSSTFIDKILDSVDLFEEQGPPGKKAVQGQDWARKFLEEADRTNPNRPRVIAPTR